MLLFETLSLFEITLYVPIWVFVYTADRFGLFNCMSVARKLQKSVLLCTKQFIFSSCYNEIFGRQKNKY